MFNACTGFFRACFKQMTACCVLILAISGGGYAIDGTTAGGNSGNETDIQILAFGDSLTAGYGLGPGEGFTDQLQTWLRDREGLRVHITNAGVSGDTTMGGRSRLDWALAPVKGGKPDLVLLALGGNDGLRGVAPDVTQNNMDAMVKTLTQRGIPVMVLGMLAPPNLGPEYAAEFDAIYPGLAATYQVPLYPFFLDGVAADPVLNQSDGIHPNADGVKIIVGKIGPFIANYLQQ